MPEPKVIHATFVVERSYPQPPERVWDALAKPEQVRRWFAEGDRHDLLDFTMEFAEGGAQRLEYRMKQGTPIAGMTILNEARFQEIVPGDRIVMATTMKLEGKRISSSQITFELLEAETGTDLVCTHQGAYFEAAGPQFHKMIEAGWIDLLGKLRLVLEAE